MAFFDFSNFEADVNRQDDFGITPLMRAAMLDRTTILKSLLNSGADDTIVDKDGRDVYEYSRIFGSEKSIEIINNFKSRDNTGSNQESNLSEFFYEDS